MPTAPFIGVGYLTANDILTDVSYQLIEPVVKTAFWDNITAGVQTIPVWDPSIYVGAQLLAGTIGLSAEVVTVTAVNPGHSFTATFVNNHQGAEPIIGATFPVQQTAGDPFFTQLEMLTYLSNAVNDFLVKAPLVYNIADVSFSGTQAIAPLPDDCMVPERISTAGYPLRETSQSNLDGVDYRWNVQALSQPYAYFRDKVGLQNFGIWPRQANTVPTEIVYTQRGTQLMGLGDGFLLPDPFLVTIKHRVLAFAYSKDGEQRAPALAKYYEQRFEMGIKVSNIILDLLKDTQDDQ